jgi:hypothetical protein
MYKGIVHTLSVNIVLPSYQMVNHVGGGGGGLDTTVNMIHLLGPAGSYTSQPDLTAGYRVSDKTRSFNTIIY